MRNRSKGNAYRRKSVRKPDPETQKRRDESAVRNIKAIKEGIREFFHDRGTKTPEVAKRLIGNADIVIAATTEAPGKRWVSRLKR